MHAEMVTDEKEGEGQTRTPFPVSLVQHSLLRVDVAKVKARMGIRGRENGKVAALAGEGQLGPQLPAAVIPVLSIRTVWGFINLYIHT